MRRPRAGRLHGVKLTVLIPAHNEAESIGKTLDSLTEQTLIPQEVVVVADNCTDATVELAGLKGARVIETVGNTDKKAGALNQAFEALWGDLDEDDYVLVMDADTQLAPRFVEIAMQRLLRYPEVGAIGAVFRGDVPTSLLEWCQSNEYARYARTIDRNKRVMVLSGTAALIRVSAVHEVAEARGTKLPGRLGDVYDSKALTEDMELTVALKSLGWELESPVACRTTTELMPTVRALVRQRVRWYRGALENLTTYGWSRVTWLYWFQQAMLVMSTLMMLLYLTFSITALVNGWLVFSPFWFGIGCIFWAERIVTAWSNGVKARLLASVLLIEFAYDLILMWSFVSAAAAAIVKSTPKWHHLEVKNV